MDSNLILNQSTLVVAHPDDEILWFSSILDNVEKIIFVFKGTKDEKVFFGRNDIFNSNLLPYSKKIKWLELEESNIFNTSNWKLPKPTKYGIKNDSINYKKNYFNIVTKLSEELIGTKNVITHNPWGEYGHEEHVQVFKAIFDLSTKQKYSVWVSGYFSEQSYSLMSLYKNLISETFINKKINKVYCESIKSIYRNKNAWTWSNNYKWPVVENFFKIEENIINSEEGAVQLPSVWNNMNFILMYKIHTNYFSKIRSIIIQVLRSLLPSLLFDLIIKNYRNLKLKVSRLGKKKN